MKNSIQTIRNYILVIAAALTMAVAPLVPVGVQAQIDKGLNTAKTDDMVTKNPDDIVKQVINIMLYFIGILSVIMIIVGGFKYITSTGDGNKVTSAKNTIMYAVIGLIVAIFAYAIVNWVVGQVK